ncbi:hypothetical protein [Gemmatimonas sp.]
MVRSVDEQIARSWQELGHRDGRVTLLQAYACAFSNARDLPLALG